MFMTNQRRLVQFQWLNEARFAVGDFRFALAVWTGGQEVRVNLVDLVVAESGTLVSGRSGLRPNFAFPLALRVRGFRLGNV